MFFKKVMNRQEMEKRVQDRDRACLISELGLGEGVQYALATPAFWDAWKDAPKGSPVKRFAPGKYPASQLGMPGGKKPVWIVFATREAKRAFEDTQSVEGPIQGLGWSAFRANGGMFLDDRHRTYRSQRVPVVAWLNCNEGRYSVNVVDSAFKLERPIPAAIVDLGDAVEWVYQNARWSRTQVWRNK